MIIHGACVCGAVSYEANVDPGDALKCCCADCRAGSGGPYRECIPTASRSFHVRGLPRTYTDVSQRTVPVVFAFCGQCGVALYAHKLNDPLWLSLWLGAVRERESLAAACFGNCAAAVSQGYSGRSSSAGDTVDHLNADKGARGEPDMDETEANALLDISDLIRWLWFSETGEDLWQDERELARISTRTSLPPQTHS